MWVSYQVVNRDGTETQNPLTVLIRFSIIRTKFQYRESLEPRSQVGEKHTGCLGRGGGVTIGTTTQTVGYTGPREIPLLVKVERGRRGLRKGSTVLWQVHGQRMGDSTVNEIFFRDLHINRRLQVLVKTGNGFVGVEKSSRSSKSNVSHPVPDSNLLTKMGNYRQHGTLFRKQKRTGPQPRL